MEIIIGLLIAITLAQAIQLGAIVFIAYVVAKTYDPLNAKFKVRN